MSGIVQIKTAEQIRDDILAALAAELGISDANLGSFIRTFTYAYASELDELFYQIYRGTVGFYIRSASGIALDERAADFDLTRDAALPALGHVTFTGSNGTVIPVGAQVAKGATPFSDEVVFQTTQGGTIATGSLVLPVRAVVAGEAGNVGTGEINEQKTSIAGVTAVSNSTATLLGREIESDATLRERLLRRIFGLSRGTPASIFQGAMDFRVQRATLALAVSDTATTLVVYEDLNLLPFPTSGTLLVGTEAITYTGLSLSRDTDGGVFAAFTGCTRGALATAAQTHSLGESVQEYVIPSRANRVQTALLEEDPNNGHVDVYIADGSELAAHSSLASAVQARLRGDGTLRNEGYRGAGITLDVFAAAVISLVVTAQVVVSPAYDTPTVFAAIKTALVRYVNGLSVGEGVLGYKIAAVISGVEGVANVLALTIQGNAFDGGAAADVSLFVNQVARCNATNITITT